MYQIERDRKHKKIQMVLNKKVAGEGYILSPATEWKYIVLTHFNRIKNKEITIMQLIDLMSDKGVRFNQKKELIKYPVEELIKYIAKLANE